MAYRCVIFDFDGTLADTEQQVFQLYNDMAEKYKYRQISHAELQNIKELNVSEIMEIVDIPFYRLPRIIKEGRRRLREGKNSIHPFKEHLERFLIELSDMTDIRGIITSNEEKTVETFLNNYYIMHYFDFIQSASLLSKQRKLRRIQKRFKLASSEILYIGDETRDVLSCHAAEVDVAAVAWGYNTQAALEKCHPTYIVETLEDILEIVKEKRDG